MRRQRGFTLVEMIVVIVLIGIIAGILVLQMRPALQSYLAIGRRANLTSQADAALRRLIADAHTAVPNSLRLRSSTDGASTCLEMVPTSMGGRFRTAPDASAGGNALVAGVTPASFDVLSTVASAPAAGDYVVIGNENDEVYGGANRAAIATNPTTTSTGNLAIALNANPLPAGYEGGRFVVVPAAQQAVTYECDNAGKNNGGGMGTLYRVSGYGFNPAQTCPVSAGAAAKVATKVAACAFIYNANEGATQESGYVQMRLGLADGDEAATLTMGAHVENVP